MRALVRESPDAQYFVRQVDGPAIGIRDPTFSFLEKLFCEVMADTIGAVERALRVRVAAFVAVSSHALERAENLDGVVLSTSGSRVDAELMSGLRDCLFHFTFQIVSRWLSSSCSLHARSN